MKTAILSNINIEPIKSHMKEAVLSGFNQYMNDLLNENSIIYNKDVRTVFIHLDGEALLGDFFYKFPDVNVVKKIDDLLNAIDLFLKKREDVTVILSNIKFPPFSFISYVDITENGFSYLENTINNKIKVFTNNYNNVLLFDFARLVSMHGYKQLCDEKYWYLGRIKYGLKGLKIISKELENLSYAFKGKIKKVLILDLDNTLWGGVIGEENINDIKLSEEGIGKCYRDLQKLIKSLKELGILLAISSKNNERDVEEFFSKNQYMILKLEDFIIKKINWNNKVLNIKEIAEELNLGLDSFVFLDDNPVERELIKSNLPEVAVPDFPNEPFKLKTWFINEIIYPFFPKINITEEDKNKQKQYKSNIKRNTLKTKFDMKDFINKLEIKTKLYLDDSSIKSRLTQLTQKTNQFNFTTKRYIEKDIINFIKDKDSHIYGIRYEDKFGDEGIIGEAIVQIKNKLAKFDIFLLSCRVIGRHIEFKFLYDILKELKNQGIEKIQMEYVPSKKNILVQGLFVEFGLKEISKNMFEGFIKDVMKVLQEKNKGVFSE